MTRSWLEELEARLEEQLEDFLRANPRQEELLAEQEARDRQISLRQERLELQQLAEVKRQRLLELAQEIRLWQQRHDKASAAGAAELATRAAAHLAVLMEQGRGDWQSLTELGQRFASIEAALDALNNSSQKARSAGVGGEGMPGPAPPASANPKGSGRAKPSAAEPRRASAAPAAANTTDHTVQTNAETNRRQPGADNPAAGAPSQVRERVDPAVDLEAAWHAFATQQELEELRRRVGGS